MSELIIALDNIDEKEARLVVSELSAAGVSWFKVGLELFSVLGPQFVSELKSKKLNVFVDLKLHDIPNTVKKAANSLASLGCDLITVHAAGGSEMLSAAVDGVKGSSSAVVAVTALTSLNESDLNRIANCFSSPKIESRTEVVYQLAKLASASGVHGIVSSANELADPRLKAIAWQGSPIFVTPGIRSERDAANDQKNIATPQFAISHGATHLVVGRPILSPAKGSRVQSAQYFLSLLQGSK